MSEPADLWSMLQSQAAAWPDKTAFTVLASDLTIRESLTYRQLRERASARAGTLAERGLAGMRVVLIAGNDIEFIVNLFAVLAVGGTAIPVNPRLILKSSDGLDGIIANAAPLALLADPAAAARLARNRPPSRDLQVEIVGGAEASSAAFQPIAIAPDSPAIIQYTSGSTSEPKGVIVTHANLIANARSLRDTFAGGPDEVAVCWLPFFHDMGLLSGLVLPVVMGAASILISPALFSARPATWLAALTRYRGTVCAAPNFAFQHCADKVSDAELAALDLSAWRIAMCGAEPVRAATVEVFCARFAAAGFDPASLLASYGLAEATLFVSGGPRSAAPRIVTIDGEALEQNLVRPPADPARARRLVSCGRPADGQGLLIVDPASRRIAPAGTVGEIWLAGPSVGAGYFGQPGLTADTFGSRLAAGEGEATDLRTFLRTGDLGFLDAGELVIAGRLKDLIIVRGMKHHPADLELTCAVCHPALAHARAAAFALPGDDQVMVIHEAVLNTPEDAPAVIAASRAALAERHGLAVDAIALAAPGTLPLTSSGKVRRAAARDAWLAGRLETLKVWSASRP